MNRKTLISEKLFDVDIDISVYDNLTIITGDSGVGKTFLFDTLRTYNLYAKEKFIFFNTELDNKISVDILSKLNKYIIFIDNADIILDNDVRKHIRCDKDNYYLILGRDIRILNINAYNLAEIKHIGNRFELEYPFIGLLLD